MVNLKCFWDNEYNIAMKNNWAQGAYVLLNFVLMK